MNDNFYLLNMSISGIKNIEKEITIDFYKKTIRNDFNPEKYRVKAIYGENGSGKTAIVQAVSILKNLIISYNYLGDSSNQKILNELVNKKSKEFCIACEFLVSVEEYKKVFRYSISLKKNEEAVFVIKNEKLEVRGINSTTKYSPVFECSDGKLIYLDETEENRSYIEQKSINLLESRTFVFNYITIIGSVKKNITRSSNVVWVLAFGLNLNTYIEKTDRHELYFLRESIRNIVSNSETSKDDVFKGLISNIDKFIEINDTSVAKKDFLSYEKKVKRLCEFLKLFKNDLREIEIDKRENKETYECILNLVYKDCKISSEFESTGINKLIKLFDCLENASRGQIAFIDEMDANINDVYLCKIVEYFMYYGNGQLCFTTHNTSPMKILKKNKNSIDFLSNDNIIVSWKTNGNFSPEKLYANGMIEYMPFNVEPSDFLGVFEE